MLSDEYAWIRENLARVEERILGACEKVGRKREEVTLVAVTKTRPVEEIIAAHRYGVRHFGENRIEEMEAKLPHLRDALAHDPPMWHMIGHIQSRKAARVVALADIVHSLDSIKLAARLERFAQEAGRVIPVLVEVNISGEASKYGFCASTPEEEAATLEALAQLETFSHLNVCGLMTMAPIVTDPEEARPIFQRLRLLRDRLREALPFSSWKELSMGMTDDFEVAVQEGATMVRIGRAIFGARSA